MAKYSQGVHGSYSGRVGNVISSKWKSINVLKIRPAQVNNPNTEKQQKQRGKFGLIMQFLNANRLLVRTGFKPYAIDMTEVNAALAANIKTAIVGEFPDYMVDFAAVKLSKGILPALSGGNISSPSAATIHVGWNDNSSNMGAHSTDKLHLSVYDPETNRAQVFMSNADRAVASSDLQISPEWSGKNLEVWAFFTDAEISGNSETISETAYLGSILLS